MWNFFNKTKKTTIFSILQTDMHSHLLANVDDGVHEEEISLIYIKNLIDLGYRKLIITPHIHSEIYPNTKKNLESLFSKLKENVKKNNLSISIELAAEYYLNNHFKDLMQKDELLTFGDRFILVETSFVGLPLDFEEILFELVTKGYKPVLAHPERYNYLSRNLKYFRNLHDRGVLLQVNLLSLIGYYGQDSLRIVDYLLKEKIVSFIGTDIHNERHLELLKKMSLSEKKINLIENQPLLNGIL